MSQIALPTARYKKEGKALFKALEAYESRFGPLPGISAPECREAFVCQVIESKRRIKYVAELLKRPIGAACGDPASPSFDPLKAAIRALQAKNHDEACWLVFLFVHFGKHSRAGWRLVQDFYAGNGSKARWTWAAVSKDPAKVTAWLAKQRLVWSKDGAKRHFGNHRKYESLKSTGAVIESYVDWVDEVGTHAALFARAASMAASTRPHDVFEELYKSLDAVDRFGRTAKFDFLTMLGKLGLAAIEPGRAYLVGATGPRAGSKLLFGSKAAAQLGVKGLESALQQLGTTLKVNQQVIEDAICNWQKSASSFIAFRG